MMRIFLFILLLFSTMSTRSQSFNEEDLLGTWYASTTDLSSIPLGGIKGFKGFYLGYTTMTDKWGNVQESSGYVFGFDDGDIEKGVRDEKIKDFFISNNNKLHIIIGENYCLRVIIETMVVGNWMSLKTYDGRFSFNMIKYDSETVVRPTIETRPTEISTYNLSGQKIENVSTDGIYINNGQKKVYKK